MLNQAGILTSSDGSHPEYLSTTYAGLSFAASR
jgi:hypothetical protein